MDSNFINWLAQMMATANLNSGLLAMILIAAIAHGLREWRLTRKLSLDDRLARRDGYAAQVSSLQAENRALREDMLVRDGKHYEEIQLVRHEYDEYRKLCEMENEQHRGAITALQDQVSGLKRRLATLGLEALNTIPARFRRPATEAAALSIAQYLQDNPGA